MGAVFASPTVKRVVRRGSREPYTRINVLKEALGSLSVYMPPLKVYIQGVYLPGPP